MTDQPTCPTPPQRHKPRILLIVAFVCVTLVVAAAIWWFAWGRQDMNTWAEDLWKEARDGETGAGRQDADKAAQAVKALLAGLPEAPMITEPTDPSVEDEQRRVSFLDGQFSLIPPAGWNKSNMDLGGLAIYESPDDSSLHVSLFPATRTDPIESIQKIQTAIMDDYRVVQNGAVTLNGRRAIVLVTRGMITEETPMQLMNVIVYYGDRSAFMLELTTTPKGYDRDRRIMEAVLRSVQTR